MPADLTLVAPPPDRSSPPARDEQSADARFDRELAELRPRLLRLVAARTRCRAEAEDVVQEALLKALRYRDRYDPRRPLAAWVYRIAIRTAIDRARRRRAAPLDPALPDPAAPAADRPDTQAAAAESADRLWAAARAALTPDQYAVVWLTYVESLAPREVAHAIGKRSGAVRVMLHRARARLADALPSPEADTDRPAQGAAP
ncbi:MAG: RNA polymerase sigma factor [Planctomycetota bacterium]